MKTIADIESLAPTIIVKKDDTKSVNELMFVAYFINAAYEIELEGHMIQTTEDQELIGQAKTLDELYDLVAISLHQ